MNPPATIDAADFTFDGLLRDGDLVVCGQTSAEPLTLTRRLAAHCAGPSRPVRIFVGTLFSDTFDEAPASASFLSYGAIGRTVRLAERGLLDDVMILTLAEFGRTPGINASLGRDHFASAWSMTMTGGGARGGAVYGKTDPKGNTVTAEEVDAGSLFATIYSNLGINPHKNYYVGARPIPLVNPGVEPVEALVK